MTLGSILDQCTLDAGVMGDEWFPPERITAIINQTVRSFQKDLITSGSKTWMVTQPVHDMESGFFLTQPVIIIPSSALQREEILEVPGQPLVFEVADPYGAGIARPVSLNIFRDSITNPYFRRSVHRAVYLPMEEKLLLLPNSIHSAVALYHRRVPELLHRDDQLLFPAESLPQLISAVTAQLVGLKERNPHETH